VVNFIEVLTQSVDVALENKLEPPFVALASEENPYLTHIPNKTMWPALIVSACHGVVLVDVYKDSQYIENSGFCYSPDFIKLVGGARLIKALLESGHG